VGGAMAIGTPVGIINVNDMKTIAGTLGIVVNGVYAELLETTGDLDLIVLTAVIEVVELGVALIMDYLVITCTVIRTGTFDIQTLPAGY
jgi:hypothetical protein